MSEHDWTPVGNALLGTWPDRVASWGPEALAFYCNELEARGVTPDTAIIAIRSLPASGFPPSATEGVHGEQVAVQVITLALGVVIGAMR